MEVWRADIIHPLDELTIEYVAGGCLVIDKGKIVALEKSIPPGASVIYDYQGKLLLPGFIDTHTHLPQYAFVGLGAPGLLQWLHNYTFPEEMKFADVVYARKVARAFFQALLQNGTTTVCSFLTTHKQAADIAFEEAERCGIRAFLGLTLMDRGNNYALQVPKKFALQHCLALIQKWHRRGNLQFVISPRFALSCTSSLMTEAGRMAADLDLLIQTHLSENHDEIRATLEAHPEAKNYADVYYKNDLLNERSLLGHCIHLGSEEIQMMVDAKAVAVHCPTSNQFLMSGIMPLRRLREAGVRVSLGSDVAGGYELSMLHEMRLCLESSKTLTHLDRLQGNTEKEPVSIEQAFYYATLGGAAALRLADVTGNFLPGKEADFVIIDDSPAIPMADAAYMSLPERLSRLVYRLNNRGVLKTVIAGQTVYEDSFASP